MDTNEYNKLIQEFYQSQYSNDDEDNNSPTVWIPDTSGIDLINKINNQQVVDATSYSKEQINKELYNFRNIKIGEFILKITKIDSSKLDISLYEQQSNTKPANFARRVDPSRDNRFENRSWSNYFKNLSMGKNIPKEEIYDIIRWLQALHRMSAFL